MNIYNIICPIVDAIKFTYKLKRINKNLDIPYNGYNTEGDDKFNTFRHTKLPKRPSAEHLKHRKALCNESALDVLVKLCFQLGVEQGKRLAYQESKQNMPKDTNRSENPYEKWALYIADFQSNNNPPSPSYSISVTTLESLGDNNNSTPKDGDNT